jgi:hypothetical protein
MFPCSPLSIVDQLPYIEMPSKKQQTPMNAIVSETDPFLSELS